MKSWYSLAKLILAPVGLVTITSCTSYFRLKSAETVILPYIKNSANECYYLDDFMPMPDSMVTGESGVLKLRYYTYKAANYKTWDKNHVILSFYSDDEKCWSLFEEYLVTE